MISETDGTIIGVYVSIGNTDNKLTCQEWAEFWEAVDLLLTRSGRNTAVYGRWHSIPTTPYVNACWAVEVPTIETGALKVELRKLAARYRQDSIAWSPTVTHFLEPLVDFAERNAAKAVTR